MKPSPMCTPKLAKSFSDTAHDLSAIDKQSRYTELTLTVLALLSCSFVVWYAGVSVSDVLTVLAKIPQWFIVYSTICLVLFPLGFWFASVAHDVSLVGLKRSEVEVQPQTVTMLEHTWDVI